MRPLKVKRKIVEWTSYFVSSSGDIYKFTFTDKQYAESLMCMFLAARKCSWIEKEERYAWFNVEYVDQNQDPPLPLVLLRIQPSGRIFYSLFRKFSQLRRIEPGDGIPVVMGKFRLFSSKNSCSFAHYVVRQSSKRQAHCCLLFYNIPFVNPVLVRATNYLGLLV